jgi:sulfoxide reductase heme-binding subunit YedZ
LIPLAITSTSGMLKRLGARRWKRLHRLVYVTAVLGVVHFVWRVKSDLREPLIFAAILAVLLGVRVVAALRLRTVVVVSARRT